MKPVYVALCLAGLACLLTVSVMSMAPAKNKYLPIGTIIAWGGNSESVPSGWLICDGASVSRKKYSKLFAALGTNWGNPSPKRFNIPDLRGRFLRGVDDNTGRDPEAHKRQPANPGGNSGGAGSVQNDSIQNHTHRDSGHSHPYIHVHNSFRTVSTASLDVSVVRTYGPYSEKDGRASLRGAVKYGTGSDIRAGEESRPKNAAIYYIIKAK